MADLSMARRFAWPARLRSRRLLVIALGVLVLLRLALPYVLRPVLVSRASQAINARVNIGDVDIALYRAGIALEDVTIRPAVTISPAAGTPETDTGDPPLIAWKRLAVAVHWLPLLHKTIQLRELILESPRVAIDRLQDGGLNLMALVPAGSGEAAPPAGAGAPSDATAAPTAKERSGWRFGIDRVDLRDGGIRFRDLMFASVEPIDLALGSFEVEDISLSPSVYGEPARIHLQVRVDEGRFALDASLSPRDDGGFALGSHLKASRLPLRRTRVYVPKVGWSELQGEFGGALDYTLETGGRNEVSGQVTVDGLTVYTPLLEGPGLAWKRLAVLVDPIDLAGHRAVVRRVDLDGSYLVARARGGVVFPFIERVLTGEQAAVGDQEPAGDESGAPPATPGAGAPAPPEPQASPPPPSAPPPPPPAPAPPPQTPSAGAEAAPWQWSVDLVRVWDSLLHVISPDAHFDVGCTMTARRLRSEGGDPASVSIELGIGDGGTLTIDGETRIQPLGFDGRAKAAQVPLPDIAATAGVFPPGVLRWGRLDADLGVAAGVLAPTPGDVRVEGTIAFDEPYLVGAGGPTLEFGAKRLAFGMQELLVPGALPEQPGTTPTADARLTGGTVSLQEMWAVRTDPTPFDVRAASLDATLDQLTAPGVGPPPSDGGALSVRGTMRVAGLFAGNAGGSGLDIGARTADVGVGEFVLPGILAVDPTTVTAPMRLAKATISLAEPSVAGSGPQKLDAGAGGITASIGELLLVPGALGGRPGDLQLRSATLRLAEPRVLDNRAGSLDARAGGIDVAVGDLLVPAATGSGAPPVRLRAAKLDVAGPRVVDARAGKVDVRARGIDVGVDDLLAPAPGGAAGETWLRGARLTLDVPAIAAADPKEFAVGARSIGVGVEEIVLAASAPTRVRLRQVTLAAPRVQVTRTPEGLKLPSFGGDGAAAPGSVTTTPTSAPAPSPAAPAAAPVGATPEPSPPSGSAPAPEAAPPLELAIGSFRLTDGRIGVTDRTVKPFYSGGLAPLEVEVADLRWPAMTMSRLRVEATSAQKGKITITGNLTPSGGTVEIDGKEIPLQQFNPYAVSLSPYSIKKGRLSVATKATFKQGKYDSDSALTLHDFDLGSRAGDSLFKEQFGIPLTMALALLRDLQGDIKLDIPVEGDEQGMQVGYLTIIAGALRRALVNALASPLKLVGAIFSGDKVQASPAPISFRTGRDALTDEGDRQVDQLAKFLAERPSMGVALETAPTNADMRWLHEHDLLEELGAPQGVFGTIKNLTKRGARDRISEALAARAEDKPGELDADDQKTLETWLAERPAPTPERVRDLAGARLARVEKALREEHGIDAGRIVRRDPPPELADASPATVEIELGSAAELKAPPPES